MKGMRNNVDTTVQTFFAAYEARFNTALGETPAVDVEGMAAAFTECFIEVSPRGVTCGKNDEHFRVQIPKGLEFYRSIGTKSMQIASLTVTALDDDHALAKVHWEARYQKQDGNEELVAFEVIYLVQIINEQPKIFGYITGDEQQLLKEKGLIPAER
jgi:hypothetical protein